MDETDQPAGRHQKALAEFLALPQEERNLRLTVGRGEPNYVEDEVVCGAARQGHREKWKDERRYSQQLVQRVYVHVRGHVAKNPGWAARGGGFDTTVGDCAGFVLMKLAGETATVCHAEIAFGDFVYKRALDFADMLFAKKNRTAESLDSDAEESSVDDASPAVQASILDELLEREDEAADQKRILEIQELVQENGLLTDKERAAFTFHWFGELKVHAKGDALCVTLLMGCSEKSAHTYLKSAMHKIKERLQ